MTEPEPTRVPISRRLAVINSASSVLTHLLNITILVWLQRHLLQRVSVEEYALFPLVSAPMLFVPLFTTFLTAGLGRYVVEAFSRGDGRRVTSIVSTMFPILLGAGAVLGAIGALVVWQIDHVLDVAPEWVTSARWMFGLLVGAAALRVAVAPFGVGLFVRQRFIVASLVGVGTQILRMAILLALLIFVDTRVLWVVVASVAAETVGLFVRIGISRRLVPDLRFRRASMDRAIAPELISFGGWTFVNNVAGTVRRGMNPIILKHFSTSAEVAVFHLGSLVFRQVQRVTSVALQPLAPPLVAMHARGETHRLSAAYLNGGRYALWLGTVVATPLMVFREEVARLYLAGTEVDPHQAATVMLLTLLPIPLRFGNIMMGRLANACGAVKPLAIRTLVLQLIALTLTIVFVARFGLGAVGAALAPVIIVSLMVPFVLLPFAHRIADVTLRRWLVKTAGPGFAPAAAGAAVWIALRLIVAPTTWIALAGCVGIGFVVFGVVTFTVGLRPQERDDFRRLVTRSMRRFRGR